DRGIASVYERHDQGVAGCQIAKELGVSESVISRLLTSRPVREADRLPFAETSDSVDTSDAETSDGVDTSDAETSEGAETSDGAEMSDAADAGAVAGVPGSNGARGVLVAASGSALVDGSSGVVGGDALAARVLEGGGRSLYAGAMLLHPFLEKVGAGDVLSALDSGPARSYDSTAVA